MFERYSPDLTWHISLWSWERLSGKISFSKRHIWAWLLKQILLSVTDPAFQNSTDFKRTERMVSNSKLPSMKKPFLSVSRASFSFYHGCTLMASSASSCSGGAGVVKCPRQPDVNKEINILPWTWKPHVASVMPGCSLPRAASALWEREFIAKQWGLMGTGCG